MSGRIGESTRYPSSLPVSTSHNIRHCTCRLRRSKNWRHLNPGRLEDQSNTRVRLNKRRRTACDKKSLEREKAENLHNTHTLKTNSKIHKIVGGQQGTGLHNARPTAFNNVFPARKRSCKRHVVCEGRRTIPRTYSQLRKSFGQHLSWLELTPICKPSCGT